MLKTLGKKIVNEKGQEIILRSIGIGGWLMMEGYMLGGKNIAEHIFKGRLRSIYGKKKLERFTSGFQKNFFNEHDVARIKKLGFNCARLPINYRVLTSKKGFKLLDDVVRWFREYNVYLILDLHAAPGSQNYDWHSDSDGVARLWQNDKYIRQAVLLWDKISKRYKNEDIIAGYDILNEPVTDKVDKINKLYSGIIKAIRNNNDKHIIFVEPNMWAADFKGIKRPKDDNFAWSIHFYLPINFTFNWNSLLKCPSRAYLKMELMKFKKFQDAENVPILVGEFGVSSRCPECNSELKWAKYVLSIFREFGWSWSYWTYKSTAGALVPDGLYRIFDHEMFRRDSAAPGMENIYKILKHNEKKLYKTLDTKNFSLHKELHKILSKRI
ncbi:MAG: glycoside hydrolase family 5 protein [bacterium]